MIGMESGCKLVTDLVQSKCLRDKMSFDYVLNKGEVLDRTGAFSIILKFRRSYLGISHWEYDTENHVQPHWKTTKTTLKGFIKDKHTNMVSLFTLKFVCYCYPRMLIPYNPTEYFQCYSLLFLLSILNITLVFQSDY